MNAVCRKRICFVTESREAEVLLSVVRRAVCPAGPVADLLPEGIREPLDRVQRVGRGVPRESGPVAVP